MKRFATIACALGLALGGCMASDGVGSSQSYLGVDEGITVTPVCEPVSGNPIANVLDETEVLGDLTFSVDGDDAVIGASLTGGWAFTKLDLYIGQIGALDLYVHNYAPADDSVELRVPLSTIAGGECGGEIKIYIYGTTTNGNETGNVSALGAGAWDDHQPRGWYDYYTVCCLPPPPPPEDEGCTLTQGYWKNHEEAWPVDSLEIGGETYTQAELLTILRTPTRGDVSLIIGHQLIAALLNGASGASASPDLTAAQTWMADNKDADGRLPYGSKDKSSTGLGDALASYNEGTSGPGHCDG